jgi:uncharacterized protein YndB with AHSA1/START domain
MINDSRGGHRVVGSLRASDGVGVVRMEDRYDTDIDDLWSALTDPARLARWVAEVDGDLRIGAGFHARFTSGWEGAGRVDTCEPPRSLQVTLSPGEEDETVIDARLFGEGESTRLVIEERGFPLSELASHGAGWQAHIEDFAAYLAGRERLDWSRRWRELTPTYRVLAESRHSSRPGG